MMNLTHLKKRTAGFTLIEIAIVLVIIGLLLGGVLKGQELINSAKVRSMNDKLTGVTAAYFAFQDRFKARPGDFHKAKTTIHGTLSNGNGNGVIHNGAEGGQVWGHMEKGGFITGSFDLKAVGVRNQACSLSSCPTNGFGSALNLSRSDLAQDQKFRHELKTGQSVPSDILAELDRKIDDDRSDSGALQIDRRAATKCQTDGQYNTISPEANCFAVYHQFD